MGLIERLATPPRAANKTLMDVWIESRPVDEQKAIREAAANPDWKPTALLRELVAEGAPDISRSTFQDWRRKQVQA